MSLLYFIHEFYQQFYSWYWSRRLKLRYNLSFKLLDFSDIVFLYFIFIHMLSSKCSRQSQVCVYYTLPYLFFSPHQSSPSHTTNRELQFKVAFDWQYSRIGRNEKFFRFLVLVVNLGRRTCKRLLVHDLVFRNYFVFR